MSSDRVSLRDVYDAVNNLESKMSSRIEKMERNIDEIQAFTNKLIGIVGFLSIFASLIASYIWNKLV